VAFEKKLYYVSKDGKPFADKNDYIRYELGEIFNETEIDVLIENKTEIMTLLAGWDQKK
jgi:hypothetical protein